MRPEPPAEPSPEFLSLIPRDFARRHLVLSLGITTDTADDAATGKHPTVARELLWTSAPAMTPAAFNVGVRLGRPVVLRQGPAAEIARAIDLAYARRAIDVAATVVPPASGPPCTPAEQCDTAPTNRPPTHAPSEIIEIDVPAGAGDPNEGREAGPGSGLDFAPSDLLDIRGKSPVVRTVDLIIFDAVCRRASDIHVQLVRDGALVRYRIDGVLHTARRLPPSLSRAVVSRLKVMAKLDIAETRSPQDGRIAVRIRSDDAARSCRGLIDIRMSTIPSSYGERVVLRLLDPARQLATLDLIGMPGDVESRFTSHLAHANGIVLATGPTGSGKTTTLYASLAWIARRAADTARSSRAGPEVNVMTIEDPVEYDLAGTLADSGESLVVSQTQVDPRKGLTFASGLRHILRQDPDVIMVGEIRDSETARIAMQASLTGHLVLSTLHTNDASTAVERLFDLGVEPFLVASSLRAVLAQRLVRRRHAPCNAEGCAACAGTGYFGRCGVFELLEVKPAIRSLIHARASANDIRAAAANLGSRSLARAAAALVEAGVTTDAEASRVIAGEEEFV